MRRRGWSEGTRRLVERGALLCGVVFLMWMAVGCASGPPKGQDLMVWDIQSSNDYVMAGETTEQVVHLEIGAQVAPGEQKRIPLNLSLVIDHSGSMSGEQMEDARRALLYMLRELHPEDTVSVIAFSSEVEVLQEQEEWGDVDREELKVKIAALKPTGTTEMQTALQVGINQVARQFRGDRINRVMLLSDGIPNDATQLVSMAQNARSRQIGISTFGLGPYYNEDLMAELADLSGGRYHFIKESAQIEEFFLAEKESLEQVIARNVSLTIQLGPGVELLQILGEKAQQHSGRKVTMHLGDFGLSDKRQVGLKYRVTAPASGARVELLDARMQWEDVVFWSGQRKRGLYLEAGSTKDQALIEKGENKVVREKVGRLEAAWQLENAMREFNNGDKEAAQRRLRSAASQYRQQLDEARSQAPTQYAPQPVPTSGEASIAVESGGFSLDLEETAEELEESDADSDEGKILIKSNMSKARQSSGR